MAALHICDSHAVDIDACVCCAQASEADVFDRCWASVVAECECAGAKKNLTGAFRRCDFEGVSPGYDDASVCDYRHSFDAVSDCGDAGA